MNSSIPNIPSGKSSPDSADPRLDELRRQIDSVDEQLVSILAKRQKIISEVTALKKARHIPVYHPAREEDLISRRRCQAQETGLDPDDIEELFRSILRQSRTRQTASLSCKGIHSGAAILIVGGRGGMGRYFHRWFSEAGYDVRTLDQDDWADVDSLCSGIELAIVSVPIHSTRDVIYSLSAHLPSDCILADITSIKEPVMNAMLDAHSGPVLGLHPLFGPTTSTMDKQIIVVTPGRRPDAYQWFLDQFSVWGGILIEASPGEHDDLMAIVQALRHFATFAFGRFLSRRKIDLKRTLEFSSPIYRLELSMVGRLFAQDPMLYADIILATPERRNLLKEYIQSLEENLELIVADDKQAFCDEFNRIAEWFGSFSEQAIRESSYLIDRLIERF